MRPAGQRLFVLAIALSLAACVPTFVEGRNVAGVTWVALDIAGRPPIPGHEPTLQFENGRLTGWGGCNGFGSDEPVAIEGDLLELPQLVITSGACANPDGTEHPANEVENRFFRVLGASDRIGFRDNGHLVISGASGALVFEARGR